MVQPTVLSHRIEFAKNCAFFPHRPARTPLRLEIVSRRLKHKFGAGQQSPARGIVALRRQGRPRGLEPATTTGCSPLGGKGAFDRPACGPARASGETDDAEAGSPCLKGGRTWSAAGNGRPLRAMSRGARRSSVRRAASAPGRVPTSSRASRSRLSILSSPPDMCA